MVVPVVVDMGFAGGGGGLAGGCGGGTVGGGMMINKVFIGMAEGAVVIRGVTGGSGLVTGILGWGPEGGNVVLHLGGKDSDAGLTVYWCPNILLEDEEGSIGVLGLVDDCVQGVTAKFKVFWGVLVSFELSGAQKTFLGHWGKILGWLVLQCSKFHYRTVSPLGYLSHGSHVSPTFHTVLQLST